MAAEIDRWRRLVEKPMRPRKLRKWDPTVRSLLHSLGFFELLDVNAEWSDGEVEDGDQLTVLPMIARTTLEQRILGSLSRVSNALHGDPTIYGALVEAAYNATKHAYPDGYNWKYQPTVKGWWATASWDASEDCVKFLVYDQGVGIAETLPRWEGWEKVRGILALLPLGVGENLNDESNMIRAALEVDRTSLAGGHGKGLQDVVEVVRGFAGSQVRILSGRGSIIYYSSEHIEVEDHALHLGGTLVEWTIPVREFEDE